MEIASSEGGRGMRGPRKVVDIDIGDDLPDSSGDPSSRIFECASSTPTAFVFEEPTAGAAF